MNMKIHDPQLGLTEKLQIFIKILRNCTIEAGSKSEPLVKLLQSLEKT